MKLRRKDLARSYGVDLRTIDRWKADGTLPRPRRLKRPYWTERQISGAERLDLLRWREREKLARAAKLRKHRIAQKIKIGQIIPNQLSLLPQLNGH